MTISIEDLRKKFPDQSNLSDGEFTWDMWSKYYKEGDNARPMGQFADEIGLSSEAFKVMTSSAESSGYEPTSSTSPDGAGYEKIVGMSLKDQTFLDPESTALTDGGLVSNYMQGLTVGGSDEISGAIAMVQETLGGGSNLSMDEIYNRAKNFEMERINDYRDKSPGKAFGAEIAGMITTGVATRGALNPITSPMRLLKNPAFLKDLIGGTRQFLINNPAIKTAFQSAGWGATYGFNAGEDGERVENSIETAKWSAILGFGLQKIGGAVSNKYKFHFNKASKSPTIENLKRLKNSAYDAVTKTGIKFETTVIDKFRRLGMYGDEAGNAAGQPIKITGSIDDAYSVNPDLYPYAKSAITLYDKTLQKMQKSGGATIQQLDDLSKNMWRLLKDSKFTEQRIYPLINSIDDMISSHPNASAAMNAAKEANKTFSKSKMMDGIVNNVVVKAEDKGGISSKYRTAIANVLTNKTLKRFLNDDDIAALENFNKIGVPDKTLKGLANLAPNLGVRGAINALSIYQVPELLLALPITMGSKMLYNSRTQKGVDDLLNYFKKFTRPPGTKVPSIPAASPALGDQVNQRTQ